MTTPGASAPDGFIPIGHVARAHGIRGDVVVMFYSDDPTRFGPGTTLWRGGDPLLIEEARPAAKGGVIVRFGGVSDRNHAETLRGTQLLLAKADRRPLEDGEYWPEDLIGLEAVDSEGTVLGRVVDVELDAAQARLVVQIPSGSRVDVPFVEAWVPDVDVEGGRVVIADLSSLIGE